MSVKDLYASKGNWLKAEDLKGRAIKVVITDATIEKVGEDDKIVLAFRGKEKTFVLNKTNAGVIADAYGDEEGGWVDREIIIYPTVTEYQGQSVPCLRVRIETDIADEEIPF